MVALNFDASTVAPQESFSVIPAGTYTVHITQSEMRSAKTGGQYLWLELDIIDGQYKGRKLWDRLNLVSSNQTAAEIAQRTLSAICHAVGVMKPQDSERLHFKPLRAKVRVHPAGKDKMGIHRDEQNEIRGYKACTSRAVAVAARDADASAAAATRAAAPPAADKWMNGPWKKAS